MSIAIGQKGLGMLKNFGSALKRTPESRACIDQKKAQGLSGGQARKQCRQQYGSRLGNAGRSLGILPEELKGVTVSKFIQQQSINRTPSKMGTVSEQFLFGGSDRINGNGTVKKAGFNYLYLLPLVFLLPQIQKLFK